MGREAHAGRWEADGGRGYSRCAVTPAGVTSMRAPPVFPSPIVQLTTSVSPTRSTPGDS